MSANQNGGLLWKPCVPPGFYQPFSTGLSVPYGLADAGQKWDIIWGEIFWQMEAVRAGDGKEKGWFEW